MDFKVECSCLRGQGYGFMDFGLWLRFNVIRLGAYGLGLRVRGMGLLQGLRIGA